MNSVYSIALGSIFQGGRWDHDANASTPWVPAVFKTTDDGTTWDRKYLTTAEGALYSLAVNPSNKKILFAGGFIKNASSQSVAALYKTTNEGTNWNSVTVALSGWSQINAIVFSPSNANRVYLCTSQGVFVSTDGGTNWQTPSSWFNAVCLVVDPITAEKAYAGSSNGVYTTTNGGTSWTNLNAGLFITDVQCMSLDPVNNTLYAGTQGGGVFRLSMPTGVREKEIPPPERFLLHQNYPNPFNASTSIRFRLLQNEAVSVRIYDGEGRAVSQLANGRFAAGEHALVWNGRTAKGLEAPTGVYFIVLETPSIRSVRKALLMK